MFIGIATYIVAEKKRVMREFSDLDKFRAALTRQFNAHGIYDVTEDEDEICLRLREDVVLEEWLAFLESFYRLRYVEAEYNWQRAMDELKQYGDTTSWMKVAHERYHECYQEGYTIQYSICGEGMYEYAKVYVNHILLSVAGKILMEYYDRMFAFFTRLVRERMASYKLADSLFVYITE